MTRNISTVVINKLDQLIANNQLAQICLTNGNSRQLFVEVVKSCVGIKEQGHNSGEMVNLFLNTLQIKPGNQWCMAFMQTCIAYVEIKLHLQSPIYPSGGCVEVWNKTNPSQRVKSIPLAGAIAIWQHQNDKSHGHTGMVLDCDGTSFHGIEGNTSEGQDNLLGLISGHGDGVRFTHRHYDLYNQYNGDMLLLGCLKPF